MRIEYRLEQVKRIALHCIKLIQDRTLKGLDKDGNEFKKYSERPFKIPYGAGNNRTIKMLLSNESAVIRKIGNEIYVIIKTGYAGYKKAYMSNTTYDGTVNLSMTGAMLRDLTPLSYDNSSFTIGFNNIELAERASFNIQRGRDFLGLSPNDLLDKRLQELLAENFDIIE